MIRLIVVLLTALFAFCSCNRDFVIELQGGYKLWQMSAVEVYVSNKDDILVVGPTVTGLEAIGPYIVGSVQKNDKVNYFVINTDSSEVIKNLDFNEWTKKLEQISLDKNIELKPPTSRFKPKLKK